MERKADGWAALVGPGDAVAIVAKNSADFLLHAFALMPAGATPAFVNWRLSPGELAEVLTLVEPTAIAADAEFAGLVDSAWSATSRGGARVVIGGGAAGGHRHLRSGLPLVPITASSREDEIGRPAVRPIVCIYLHWKGNGWRIDAIARCAAFRMPPLPHRSVVAGSSWSPGPCRRRAGA